MATNVMAKSQQRELPDKRVTTVCYSRQHHLSGFLNLSPYCVQAGLLEPAGVYARPVPVNEPDVVVIVGLGPELFRLPTRDIVHADAVGGDGSIWACNVLRKGAVGLWDG